MLTEIPEELFMVPQNNGSLQQKTTSRNLDIRN